MELKATWSATKYTITYDVGDGKNAETNPVEYTIESEDITLADATGPEATPNFVAWHTSAKPEEGEWADVVSGVAIEKGTTGNKTFYAEYSATAVYTVTYKGADDAVISTVKVAEGKTATAPTISGKKIEGYYSDKAMSTAFDLAKTAITADTTIYVKVSVIKYKVTFDTDGGSAIVAVEVESGAKATKPTDPTKEGYTFKGWSLDEKEYKFTETVVADVTLKATWEKNPTPITLEISSYAVQEESGNVDGKLPLSTLEFLSVAYDTIEFELKNTGADARDGWGVICLVAEDDGYGWNKFVSDADLNTDGYGQLSCSSLPAGETATVSININTLIEKMKSVEGKTIVNLMLQTSNDVILVGTTANGIEKELEDYSLTTYTVQEESGNVDGKLALSLLELYSKHFSTLQFELKNTGADARDGWGVICLVAEDDGYGWNKFISDADLNTDGYGQLSCSSLPAGETATVSININTLIEKMKSIEDKTIVNLMLQTSNNVILIGTKLAN